MNFLADITKKSNGKTHLITSENVYGEKGRGGMAKLSSEPQEEVLRIGQPWTGPNGPSRDLGTGFKCRANTMFPAGAEMKLMDIDGSGVITHIWCTIGPEVLRDIILRAYWDNEISPSIEVPLGDFFCLPWCTANDIKSIPFSVNPFCSMNCFLQMPFRSHARITIENRKPVNLPNFFYAISYEEREVSDDEMYLHAQFRRQNPTIPKQDYVIADGIVGKGNYIGTVIGWQQNTQGWWGEGEIKAYIDGDTDFPTYCGTGTEDYFLGAWGFESNYTSAFSGYTDLMTLGDHPRQTNTVGNRHSMYRFHITDPIRFEHDFKITVQALGWHSEGRYNALQDDICSVAYWYQTEEHAPFPPLPSRDALEVV